MEVSSHKRIGLTIGDPAGIGPELALRVAADWPDSSQALLVLIGDHALLMRVGQAIGLACPPPITERQLAEHRRGAAVLSVGALRADEVTPGHWTADTGKHSYQWVRFAIEAATRRSIDGMVTGPIQKEAWHAAGIEFPGHTELLAEMTGTDDYCMMLTSPQISCVLATIHLPLADVARSLCWESIYRAIRLGHAALTRALGRPARVSVCGLNPHAGENGLFSHGEEEQIILPAIHRARSEGIEVAGPLSPDTAFVPAQRQATDVYVCMYHDQGLIPLKALAFDDAVNVTLGLPIVRTSVDHGTAMDIAWRGVASDQSLRAAIQMAIQLA
ncbi:MAG: 4-hydroxythreonine-4-phosphate dehydrogenase PdxA [Planctomycetaceae bacterium]